MKPTYTAEEAADTISLCTDALNLFLEYRDKHGKPEVEAKILAMMEISEGLGVDLTENGGDL